MRDNVQAGGPEDYTLGQLQKPVE